MYVFHLLIPILLCIIDSIPTYNLPGSLDSLLLALQFTTDDFCWEYLFGIVQ